MYLAKQRSSCRKRTIGIQGFTLLELAVTVIIIAVIAVVALPMYKHAILKSRFSTVMPMAKAVADAQEIYYLGNNQYALGKEDLDIAPVEAENTQVSLSPAEEDEEYIYVAANRTDIPNVRYIMYQKNSPKFAGNIHCEADANDEDALWLCEKALHGTEVTGSLQGKQYKTFLLAGDLGGSSFKVCPENAVCNDEGNVTGCESGYYQEEQTCKEEKACDESKKTIRTSCAEDCGEEIKEGMCNVKTGEWENYTVTQACPEKPSEELNCDNGVSGKMTRVSQCQNNTWTEPTWDKSQCCNPNDNNKPDEEYICHDHDTNTCGKKTRTVTCDTNGQWVADDNGWQGSCIDKPADEVATCDSGYTGNKTRAATCKADNTEWEFTGNYVTTTCCNDTQKTETKTCDSGCGKQTRTASTCNNGTWTGWGSWTGSCPSKPGDMTTSCPPGKNGRETYTFVCNSAGTGWTSQLKSSNCTTVQPGGTFRSGNYCSSYGSTSSCNGYTFASGAYCWAYDTSSCAGTYESGAHCIAAVTGACGGATYKAGAYCIGSTSGSRHNYCAAGTPTGVAGQCWDGSGGKVAC